MSRIGPDDPPQFSNILAHLHNPPPPRKVESPPPDLFPEEEKKEPQYIPTDDSDSDIEVNDFRLVTTIRWDPVLTEDRKDWHSTLSAEPRSPFLLLPYHFERLIRAASACGWTDVANQLMRLDSLPKFTAMLDDAVKDLAKNNSGDAKVEKSYKVDGHFFLVLTREYLIRDCDRLGAS